MPTPEVLESWLRSIVAWGYRSVRTNALGPAMTEAFATADFIAAQHLTLLEHAVGGTRDGRGFEQFPTHPRHDVRSTSGSAALLALRARTSLIRSALDIDEAAFPTEWALDSTSLSDALRATPRSRLFHVTGNGGMAGYLLVGVGNDTCYIQRLAVHPDHQQQGVARALMERGVEWARRLGATNSVVNTEVDNAPALSLYTSMGFSPMDHGLTVMERMLP